MSRIRKDFESKLHEARCRAENCAEENANLHKNRNCLQLQLNDEEAAQKRAEQDAEKLRLTLRFERDLHRQEMKEICRQSKINNQRTHVQISERYKAQLNDSLNNLRGQLEDHLRLNHLNFNDHMKLVQGAGMTVDMGGAGMAAISTAHGSLTSTSGQIADLNLKLANCTQMVSSLETLLKHWVSVLADDKNQIGHLEKIIKELCKKYQALLNDKVKIQQELEAYNNMLKCEESRLRVTDLCDLNPVADAGGSSGENGDDGDNVKYNIEIAISKP